MMSSPMTSKVAVFLDRDGTLNEDHGYVTSPEQLVVFPEVPMALARLNRLGTKVILVTNQSAIGRGMMTEEDLGHIHQKLKDTLCVHQGTIDAIYYCPHHPKENCSCRKPEIALIQQAANDFALDLSRCYFVGDKSSDLAAAYNAGVQGVLVMSSEYSEAAIGDSERGLFPIAHIAKSCVEAVDWIEQDLLHQFSQIPLE